MIITGAGGMAKELFEVLHQNKYPEEIFFFDDINPGLPERLFGARILKSISEAENAFQKNNNFVLGLGNPFLRGKLSMKFNAIGGVLNTLISPFAQIGKFGNTIEPGCNIMTGAVITNNVSLGQGVLVNINASISHDSTIGDFVEISPGVSVAGRCSIGAYALIGINATILPGIKIGSKSIVGAGAVVTKDVAGGIVVAGVPAKPLIKIPVKTGIN